MYDPFHDEPRYLTFRGVLNSYPFTEGQLRDFVYRKEATGFDKIIRKIGRRLYFRVDLLNDWFENRQKENPNEL